MLRLALKLIALCVLITSSSGCLLLVGSLLDEYRKKKQEEHVQKYLENQRDEQEYYYQQRAKEIEVEKTRQKAQRIEQQRQLKEGEMIPAEYARALFEYNLGGHTCSGKVHVNIRLEEVPAHSSVLVPQNEANILRFKGLFRTLDYRADTTMAQTPIMVDTPIKGVFNRAGGFLLLQSEGQLETGQTNVARLQLDVARDLEGKGWVGGIDDDRFEDCNQITLVSLPISSKRGLATDKLPPITSRVALVRASRGGIELPFDEGWYSGLPRGYDDTPKVQAYWLGIAEKQPSESDLFPLGQLYEKLGQRSPQNYLKAIQYYSSAANRTDDMRAQAALGRMHGEGLGTPKNNSESQRWNQLAAETNKIATEICISPKTITAMVKLMNKRRQDQMGMELLTTALTGVKVDLGTAIRFSMPTAKNVISSKTKFDCEVMAQNVDPSADASAVPDYYAGVDGYGNIHYRDNWFDKSVKSGVAKIVEGFARMAYKLSFVVEPLGNRRYNFTLTDTPGHSVLIDMN